MTNINFWSEKKLTKLSDASTLKMTEDSLSVVGELCSCAFTSCVVVVVGKY